MKDCIGSFLVRYPIIELLVFIFWMGFLSLNWLKFKKPDPDKMAVFLKNEERGLAATHVKDTISASLTATSIILAATALLLGFYKDAGALPAIVKIHYKYVAGYSLASICLGVLNMAYLPTVINTKNLAFERWPNIGSAIQFTLMAFAVFRIFWATFWF